MKTIGEEVYNHTVQYKMECFTKHVNRMLRNSTLVNDWAFRYTHGCILVVLIDYVCDYHSRKMFDILSHDIDETRMEFDHYIARDVEELRKRLYIEGEISEKDK